MRPTPERLPDEQLAPVCRAMGLEEPERLNEATRAAVQAATRAEMQPNRKAPRRQPCAPTSFAFGDRFKDMKRRAANDFDEE
ncbi:hypothetical protein [Paraburkholderia sp. BR14312]|uniref:hypothetical protein n=1 Tax=unclassified Paraburkholderia TaxID=2615204 RepID=UPI0034CEA0BC